MYESDSGRYHVRFRYAGMSFKRSVKTSSEKEARSVLGRIEETLRLLERGSLAIPADADPGTFILSDDKRKGKPTPPKIRTLGELFTVYKENLPVGAKEQTTLDGEEIHIQHLLRHLGSKRRVQAMAVHDLQTYVSKRSHDKWQGKLISGDTIKKEITTFRLIWNWAVRQGYLNEKPPVNGIEYPKRDERPPFMSWTEIERKVARSSLSAGQQDELWACLFLTQEQIDEVLKFVKREAQYAFIYSMFTFAAHTGARRSEILRSRVDDFNFDEGTVQIREKKKRRDLRITFRRVELTPLLDEVMRSWFKIHPGGDFTITPPLSMPRGKLREVYSPLTVGEARDHFKRTLAGSQWKKIRGFHVFRHSFASNAAYAGVAEPVIDAWMGHQTEEMRRRYRHLFPAQRRSAIELVFGRNGK